MSTDHFNTKLIEIGTSKSWVFKCFWYSDPHYTWKRALKLPESQNIRIWDAWMWSMKLKCWVILDWQIWEVWLKIKNVKRHIVDGDSKQVRSLRRKFHSVNLFRDALVDGYRLVRPPNVEDEDGAGLSSDDQVVLGVWSPGQTCRPHCGVFVCAWKCKNVWLNVVSALCTTPGCTTIPTIL